jgi:hypothetical protein
MSTRKDLPGVTAANFQERVREALQTYLGRQGSPLDRGLTVRDLLESGVVELGKGYSSSAQIVPLIPTGAGSDPSYEPDLAPPPPPDTLTATPAISHILLEVPAAFYTQGHGHLRTRIYGATWESGPLPTFADAVEVGQFSGTIWAMPSNPATTWHLWAKWESVDGVLSATPTGGTNGVVATTGEDVSMLVLSMTGPGNPFKVVTDEITLPDGSVVPPGTYTADAFIHNGQITNAKIANLAVDDAKISSLSADKLTAGTIAVGQHIQGTGYVAGSAGWRINGDGTAEFSGVVVRGTIFASQGAIGGWTIGSNYLQSSAYVLGDTGTRLNSDGTGQIGGLLIGASHIQSQNYVLGVSGWRLAADGTGQIVASQIYSANWSAIVGASKPEDGANYSTVGTGTGGSADLMLGVTELGEYQIKPLRAGFGTVVASYADDGYSTVSINSTASEYDHIAMGSGVNVGFSSTTFANLAGMLLTLPDSLFGTPIIVEIEGTLIVNTAATTTGIGINIVSEAAVVGAFNVPLTSTAWGTYALGGVSTGMLATTNNVVHFKAIAVLGAHQTFQLQIRSEVAGSAVTVREGSYMTIKALRNTISPVATTLVDPDILTPLEASTINPALGGTATATARILFNNNGTYSEYTNAVVAKAGTYLNNTVTGAGAGYEVRITKTAQTGSVTYTAPTGWVKLDSAREAKIVAYNSGAPFDSTRVVSGSVNLTIEFRPVGGAVAFTEYLVMTAYTRTVGNPSGA